MTAKGKTSMPSTLYLTRERPPNPAGGEPPRARPTVSHPRPDDLVELIAERFRALSEPTRIRLLDRLRAGEATVLELSGLTGTTAQNVSKHLGVLQRAGIVARRKQGNFAYYRVIDDGVFALRDAVCGSLQQQVQSLGRLVRG